VLDVGLSERCGRDTHDESCGRTGNGHAPAGGDGEESHR
jgi:hypothetical protein